jgi:hypothetical protein
MPTNITAADHGGSVPVLSVSCPSDKENAKAADIRTAVAALLAECDDLRTGAGGLDEMVLKAGDTMTGLLTANAGITVGSGQILTLAGVEIAGDFYTSGTARLAGRKSINRVRSTLSDANQTISVNTGDRAQLVAVPAAPRTITISHTTPVPVIGETIALFWFPKTAALSPGVQYGIEREDTTVIAQFSASAILNTGLVFAEFEYQAGGWRLGENSGTLHDGTGYYGVIGGPGA